MKETFLVAGKQILLAVVSSDYEGYVTDLRAREPWPTGMAMSLRESLRTG